MLPFLGKVAGGRPPLDARDRRTTRLVRVAHRLADGRCKFDKVPGRVR